MSRARRLGACLVAIAALGASAPPAQGAAEDPLFVFRPLPPPPQFPPIPPPAGLFEGPCGLGVDTAGNFYVADYYHDAVDAFNPSSGYLGQLTAVDPLDGPCALALDASNRLYVNDYHRAVLRYGALGAFGPATQIAGPTPGGAENPTGIALDPASGDLYVDQRTRIAVFDSSGAPLGQIGEGSLQDGYGLAFSAHPGTQGYLYVPDAATGTVKVYDPSIDSEDPVEEIDGSATPNGEFVSLRDAAVAVDRVTGEVYVVDDLQPTYTERPQAIVYVFDSAGAYEGHLKVPVEDALPTGLAVDNSAEATQGRVYVTSGNTDFAAVYAYGPGAASTAPIKLAGAGPSPALQEAAPPASDSAVTPSSAPQPRPAALAPASGAAASPQKRVQPKHRHRHRRTARKGAERSR